LGGERDADKVPAVLVPAQAAVTAASVSDEPVLNGRKKKNKPMSEQGRELEAWASGIKEHVSYIGKPGFGESMELRKRGDFQT